MSSLYNKFDKQKIFKINKESILKPKNKFNLNSKLNDKVILYNDIKNSEINQNIKIKPKYKYCFKNIFHQKINSFQNNNQIKLYDSNNLTTINCNKKIINKNNSFLNNKTIFSKDNILLKLNKLQNKLRLNSTKTSSSFNKVNKINTDITNNNINYKNFEDNKSCFSSETFRKFKKINNLILRNDIKGKKLIYNKTQNNSHNNERRINSFNTTKKVKNDNKINAISIKETERSLTFNTKKENIEKEELIKENEKLKKEIEYYKQQLEKYKKYRELYLNLLKKVKTNKTLLKNININIQNINEDNYLNNYVKELFDRGQEINNYLNENEMLEKNIKEILSKYE